MAKNIFFAFLSKIFKYFSRTFFPLQSNLLFKQFMQKQQQQQQQLQKQSVIFHKLMHNLQ